MSAKRNTPKGFNCTLCGKFHEFTAYVFAHWTTKLYHRCDKCLVVHMLQCGVATKSRKKTMSIEQAIQTEKGGAS